MQPSVAFLAALSSLAIAAPQELSKAQLCRSQGGPDTAECARALLACTDQNQNPTYDAFVACVDSFKLDADPYDRNTNWGIVDDAVVQSGPLLPYEEDGARPINFDRIIPKKSN